MYEDDHSNDSNSRRWMFYWNHNAVIDQVWRLNADYTKVSDPDYFNDFSSKYGSSTDGYATQKFSAGYVNQNFDATVSTKQFRVFDRSSSNSYAAEPQLDINAYQNDVGPFDTHLYAQAVHFVNTNGDMPEATRLHMEPTINLPLSNGWGSINTEAKLLATHYQQSNLDQYNTANGTDYKDSVNRVMPQFKNRRQNGLRTRYAGRVYPDPRNRACSTCTSRIATRATLASTTRHCCSPTIAACSATAPTAALTVSRQLTGHHRRHISRI